MNDTCRWTVAAMLYFLASGASAQTPLDLARTQYAKENWDEALALLQTAQREHPSPEVSRLLGLTLYQLQDYQAARPILEEALAGSPSDPELLAALTGISHAQGDKLAALDYAERLVQLDDTPRAALTASRAFADAGAHAQATAALEQAWQDGTLRVRQRAALELAVLYAEDGRANAARQLVASAIALDAQSFDAAPLLELENSLGQPAPRNYTVALGYWLENDDNVPLVNDPGAIPGLSDTEDIRHTFYGDFLYARNISTSGTFFGEAHFTHGIHQDLNQYDPTQIALVAGLGWSFENWGLRLPLQGTRNWIDGDTLRTNVALAPGVFFQPSEKSTLYFFAAFAEDDFEDVIRPSEDRSGDVTTLGVMFNTALGQSGALRAILTGTEYDTDGNNWQRDETRLYAFLTWGFSATVTGGVGFDYVEAEFDNLSDVFLRARDDETGVGFATLAWQFNPRWTLRGQLSSGSRDSTIRIFEYDRTVISAGVSWVY